MLMYFGIVFTIFLGILLHYTFVWSGRSFLVSFFAPTNESLFEHLKLLLTPYLLWTLVEYVHYGQFMHAFIPSKVISLYAGLILLVGLYLLYTRLTKAPTALGASLVFAFTVVVTFVFSEFLMTLTFMDNAGLEIFFDAVLVLTVILFAMFTIYPPRGWLFDVGR